MSSGLYIGLGVGSGILVILVGIFFSLKGKKKEKNPLVPRSKDTIVMINQRILSMNSRIQKYDEEITKLLAVKEQKNIPLLDENISLDDVPHIIETKKAEVTNLIADIKDLEDYKKEIKELLKQKDEKKWSELETLLEKTKEKMRLRYL